MYRNYNSLSTGRDTCLKNRIGVDVGSPPKPNYRRSWWLMCLSLLFLLTGNFVSAQTTVIDPAGDGGFNNGVTFATNGWTVANYGSSVNQWVAGTAIATAPFAGRSAYISQNGGTTSTYDKTSTNHVYFYRDVTIPVGSVYIPLSFNWICNGNDPTDWDIMQVFIAPTSVTPVGGAHPGSGAALIPTDIAGATVLGAFSLQTTVQTANLQIPSSYAGQTIRLMFMWKSDTSAGVDPPAAVDNISLLAYNTYPVVTANVGGGLWSAPGTWVGGVVPNGIDVTIPSGTTVTVDVAPSEHTLNVDGTLLWASAGGTMTLSGNLNVSASGVFSPFNGTTGKSVAVAGNITNDGAMDFSKGTATNNVLTLNGSTVQTVSGSGTFVSGVIRNLTFNNASVSNPNINWGFNNINVGGNLTFTAGKVALGANKLTLGTGTATGTGAGAIGALAYTAGGFTNGTFVRYWAVTGNGTTITAGADASAAGGRYPFVSATGAQRSAFIDRTGTLAAGQLSCTYVDASTNSAVSVVDGAYTVQTRFDGNWTFSVEGSGYAGNLEVQLMGAGAYSSVNGNSRVLLAAAAAGGTHQNGTATPGAQRIMSVADITAGALYIGAGNADIPFVSIVATGDWSAPGSWNKGTVPTCTDAVVIASGNNITVSTAGNLSSNLTINSGGTLTVSAGDLTVGCTNNNTPLTNNGTLAVSGGNLNINGNLNIASTTATMNQSGGTIKIDGNAGGVAANSVAASTALFNSLSNSVSLTGGTLLFVDPHTAATAATGYTLKFDNGTATPASLTASPAHITQFGDGVSTDAGGHTNGFYVDPWTNTAYLSLGSIVVNGGAGTNRQVVAQYQFTANGDVTINTGSTLNPASSLLVGRNLTVNAGGTFINTTGVIACILSGNTGSNLTFAPTTSAQTFTNNGTLSNLAASPTANFTAFTVNNSNPAGLTLASPFSISGTMTLTLGKVNTTAVNLLTLGTATAGGTLAAAGATAYVDGPFARTFAASRASTGTYTALGVNHFPVGKAGAYNPVFIDPTTNAGGAVKFSAEAFASNSGSLGSGVTTLSTKRYEALPISGAANLTSANIRLTDAAIVATNKILQSTTAAGAYGPILPSTNFAAGTLTTATPILVANYNGYFAFGDITPCVAPADQATAFVASGITTTTFTGNYTAAASTPTGYLVVRYASGGAVTNPTDYTTYAAGNALGAGTVAYFGPATTFNATGLTANTTYDYRVFSFANTACAGPVYNITTPLLASVTTCATTIAAPGAPAASNLLSDGVTVTWTASSTPGVNYAIDVATNSGFTTFVSGYQNQDLGTGTLTTNVTGLTSNTTYYIRVRATSGVCSSANTATLTVTTPCTAVGLPYTEDFQSVTAPALPACTSVVKTGNGNLWATSSTAGADYGFPTTALLYTYNSASAANTWFFTKGLNLVSGTTYRIKYKYGGTADYPERLKVAYGNSPLAAAMTNTLATYNNVINDTPISEQIDFTPASTGVYYFGFNAFSTADQFYLFVDDISVDLAPPCVEPSAVVVSAITTTTATVSWTAPTPAPAVGYDYYLDTVNTAPLEATVPTGSVATPDVHVDLSSLDDATTYYVWVRSSCGPGEVSAWTLGTTFATECNSAAIPTANETFATLGLPVCWSTSLVSGTENWAPVTDNDGVDAPHTGDYFMGKEYAASNALVVSQPIDMTTAGVQGARMNVWVYRSTANKASDRIRFHVNTAKNLTGATQLLQINPLISSAPAVASAGWYNYIVDIPASYNGATALYVIAQGTTDGSFTSYGIGFDDFMVENIPACLTPSNVVAEGTYTQATVTYTASASTPADGYEYEVRSSGAAGSGAVGLEDDGAVGAGVLTFNSTLALGDYFVYVRAVCDGALDIRSAWTTAVPVHIGYCLPTTTYGCADGDVIARVTLNTLDNESGTGCPSDPDPNDDSSVENAQGPGYSDYTGDPLLTTTLQAGATYDCTVFAGEWGEGYAAWIDYNDDGVFGAGEKIGNSSGIVAGSGIGGELGDSATFQIHLACNPPLGEHRLRIRAMYDTGGALVTPCTDNDFGEIEDYIITISSPAACPQPSALNATQASDSEESLSWTIGCSEVLWDVDVSVAGGGAPVGTPSDVGVTMPFVKTGLTSGIDYEYYVRADCGGGSTSVWSGPFAFALTPVADLTTVEGPATINATTNIAFDLVGHVQEAGLTNVPPNVAGETPGIEFWVGANATDVDPSTWDEASWLAADWNSAVSANYEEYTLNVNVGVAGTLYFATRARIGGEDSNFTYGGTNAGIGGNWDGVVYTNGVIITSDPAPLTNDDFADAIAVSCLDTVTGSTDEATNDEPNPAIFGVSADESPNVWYSFTGSGAPQAITLSLCNSGYDTAILVATGTAGNLTYIAGNEDFCGLRSQVSFNSDGVTTYWIMVRGYDDVSTGGYELSVACAAACTPAAGNDECAAAEAVTLGSGYASNNTCATASVDSYPTCGSQFASYYDTWYTFNSGSFTALQASLAFTAPVALGYAVYGGTCGALTQLYCSTTGANLNMTGMSLNTVYYVRVFSTSTGGRGSFTLNVSATPCGTPTTWNGTAWSNGDPVISQPAIIAGNYSSTGDLSACSLTVSSGTVTVNSGHDFNITGAVTVSGGSLTFSNGANLIQTNDVANTGSITVLRDATMRRLDYVYWGSPVAGQDLKAFSPQTVSPPVGASRFYTMNEATNAFVVISEPNGVPFAEGKGYMLRAPNNFPTNGSQATFNGVFSGVPNNGDAPIAITNTPGTGQGFNMLGNPYPSSLSADLFLAQNPGALYFWTHSNQNAASGANYATYTNLGTAAAAGGPAPDGAIAIGQGFLLKTAASGTATFMNSMRTGNNSAYFFRNANVEKNRIWLNLSNAVGTQNQILVGYMEGATMDADVSIDAKQIEGAISNIASLIGDEKYNIQGRALPFVNTDEIPLSFNALTAGTFTISIDHVDGLFSADQDVFIKDNVSGIIHNVKESGYTFAAEAGITTNRFSVVFQDATLHVENPTFDANNVVIFKNNNVLNINSGNVTMSGVKVFDIRGRLIFEQSDINANTAVLTNLRAEQEVLLVQITATDNRVVTKKVVY